MDILVVVVVVVVVPVIRNLDRRQAESMGSRCGERFERFLARKSSIRWKKDNQSKKQTSVVAFIRELSRVGRTIHGELSFESFPLKIVWRELVEEVFIVGSPSRVCLSRGLFHSD